MESKPHTPKIQLGSDLVPGHEAAARGGAGPDSVQTSIFYRGRFSLLCWGGNEDLGNLCQMLFLVAVVSHCGARIRDFPPF